ncbi:hypothetical protein QBC36DRAFT_110758, partial [Triangularia setosa]
LGRFKYPKKKDNKSNAHQSTGCANSQDRLDLARWRSPAASRTKRSESSQADFAMAHPPADVTDAASGRGRATSPTDKDREQSRKEVRFSVDAFQWHIPKNKKLDTAVSKAAARASEAILSSPHQEDTAAWGAIVVDAAGNEQEIPAAEVSYAVFRREISKRLDDLRYHTSYDTVLSDQTERLLSLAEQYASHEGPSIPFQAIHEHDKDETPIGFKGVLHEDKWIESRNALTRCGRNSVSFAMS